VRLTNGRYPNATAVDAAIKSAARNAHQADSARQIGDLIRQAHYDRFLCRVFSGGEDSEWVLKGGSGILARVPNARRTRDADLYRSGYDKDQALTELLQLVEVDLGDYFTFTYRTRRAILAGDMQPYTDGYRVTFDALLGAKVLDPINVDLSAHEGGTEGVTVADPANRLVLPKLVDVPYRLYPVANQVADKVCAALEEPQGRPSSREKDLVDLVVIGLTQSPTAVAVRTAVEQECRKRRLPFPSRFAVPPAWGRNYARDAKNTLAERYDITAAQALVDKLLGPIFTGDAAGVWHPHTQTWE
jgi:hypothetical protein